MITPVFEIFNPIGSLFYASSRSDCPLFLHKNSEILRPIVGQMFYQNVLFKSFLKIVNKHFLDPLFSLILDLFDLRSDWVKFFIAF